MAIKGMKQREVVAVYDPAKGAYRDTPVAEALAQLKSLGFSDAEAQKRVKELVEAQHGPKED